MPLLTLIRWLADAPVLTLLLSAQLGLGTTFWRHLDPGNPHPRMACHRRAQGVPEYVDDHGAWLAHRTWRCGTLVAVTCPRTRRWALARVGDRLGRGISSLDMTRAVTRRLGHSGREPVLAIPLEDPR